MTAEENWGTTANGYEIFRGQGDGNVLKLDCNAGCRSYEYIKQN